MESSFTKGWTEKWLRGGRLLALGLASVAVLALALSCARRPVKLRWKLEPGKTYVYTNEVQGTWKIEGWELGPRGGQFGNLLTSSMQVIAREADTAFLIKESIELIRTGQKYAPTVVTYRMAPDGKLYGITALDTGSAPRVFQRSEALKRQYFEQTQPLYPERELKPGETWVQETKVVLGDKVLTTESKFEVKGWEKVGSYLCLRIDYKSNTVIPFEEGGRSLVERGEVKGSLWFAPDEGIPIQQRDSNYVSIERIVPEGQKPPATYVVQSERTYKLVEIR